MNDLESEIRSALRLQAEQLHPGADVADYARPNPPSTDTTRRRLAAVTLLAAAAIVGAVVVAQRDPATKVTFGTAPPAFQYRTGTVRLAADSIEVIAGGRTWTPSAGVVLHSDPGLWQQYTTLELSWLEAGTEQRIHLYFTADSTQWWVNEIRTSNGLTAADWLEPAAQGQYFRSPLGTAFVGDLNLTNLRITGLTLEFFPPPAVCGGRDPLALIANYPSIKAAQGGGFATAFQILDTATCSPIPVAPFRFEVESADPTVVEVVEQEPIEDYPPQLFRVVLSFRRPGVTELWVEAYPASGGPALSILVPITVLQNMELPGPASIDTTAPVVTSGHLVTSAVCDAATAEARAFHEIVVAALTELGWSDGEPAQSRYSESRVDPVGRLFEDSSVDGDRDLLVAATVGLDLEAARRALAADGSPPIERSGLRIYVGTDGPSARAVQILTAQAFIYVRSEAQGVDGSRTLDELTRLGTALAKSDWLTEVSPELPDALVGCEPVSTTVAGVGG